MSWPVVELQELALQQKGAIVSGPFGSNIGSRFFVDTGVPIIRGNNLTKGEQKFIDSGFVYLTESKAAEFPNCIAIPHDLVFTAAGSIGQVGLIPAEPNYERYVISNKQLRVRLDETKAIPLFVYYWLSSKRMIRYLISMNNGGAVPLLNLGIIRRVPVPQPDIETQKRIASILTAYDDLIENNRRRIQLLEQSARLLYKEWFVHLRFPGYEHVRIVDGVPEGWENVALSELCMDIRESVDPKNLPPDTPYIGLEHIPRRSITLAEWGVASQIDSNKFKFIKGDILFGKIRPYFHKVGFALVNGIASSDAIVIRTTESVLYQYVLFLLSSDEFVDLASKTVREGSKMPRADWKFLLKFDFRLPPKALLTSFSNVVTPICNQLQILALHNRQLGQARDLLLPRLMNGKL